MLQLLALRTNMLAQKTLANNSVLFSRLGDVAHCKLNKPKALNALDQEMLQSIGRQVKVWEAENVGAVILSGEG
jgi:enoyl-CoA hydratase/carnithine racemase